MKRINRSWMVSVILALALGSTGAAAAQGVTIALGSEPTTLDPQLREDGGERAVNDNIYETLMVRTPDGKLATGLAAANPKLIDPQTWEVRLRQGDRVVTSRGVNEDIVLASVNAYLNGVNLYQYIKKEKR